MPAEARGAHQKIHIAVVENRPATPGSRWRRHAAGFEFDLKFSGTLKTF
jgi:hypothetical protein